MFLPLLVSFYFMLFISLGLAILSNSWFSIWVSLELNMIAFLPIFTASGSLFQLENSVKYFLTQAVASLWFFFSSVLALLFLKVSVSVFIILSMVVKLGLAPCHMWFFSVVLSSSWASIFLLSTVQKLIPLLIISRVSGPAWVVVWVIFMSVVVVTTGGMRQMSFRKVLTFSSLNNVSWMVASTTASSHMWGFYLMSYTTMLGPLILILGSGGMSFTGNMVMTSVTRQDVLLILALLFSLGGLPPLLGFYNKLVVGKLLLFSSSLVLLSLVVLSSLVLLFFYTTLAFCASSSGPSYLGNTKGYYPTMVKSVGVSPMVLMLVFSGLVGS